MSVPQKKYHFRPTPFHMTRKGGDWRIGYGVCSFLVAEGSGFSAPVGRQLLKALNHEARQGRFKLQVQSKQRYK